MGYKQELIKRASDAFDSDAFVSTDQYATAVNPKVWDAKLRDYQEQNLIVTPLAEFVDFRIPGRDYTVTIDAAPTEAAAVAETDAIAIDPITNSQVTFTPTEYGKAFQTSRKEMVRAFFNVMENMSKKLGYALAKKKDSLAITELTDNAGNKIVANDVASSAVASTDTLNYASLTKAARLIETNLYEPKLVIVNSYGKQQLLDLTTVHKVDEFGTRDAVEKGLVGDLFGLKIYYTNQIGVSSSTSKAIVLGETGSGEKAFGYALKRDPMIEQEYDALRRQFTIVGHEEYDFAVYHANAIVTIQHYAA